MGALLAAMLPVGNVMAQTKTVQVTARTLDRVPLVSATIYGDTATGLTYFVDSANFDASYVGAISVDSMPYSTTLTIDPSADYSTASGTVDSATYAISVIVLRDANNKVYVLGNVSPANRALGVFQATNLMMGNTMDYTVSAQSNMMVYNALINNRGYSYNSILGASTYATEGDTLRVNGNIAAGITDSVVNPVVLNLAGDTVNGQIAITHTSGTVTVMGGKINSIAGDANNAPVTLKAIDSLGSYNPGQHTTAIESGNYGILYTASGAQYSITGGCFTAAYPGLCANRFSFGPNTGANSALYPYTIVPGYTVTWNNWNYVGGVKDTIYNEADNKIRPVVASPFAPTSDTMLVGRFVDAGFTTPWDFLHDTLSSDTTIYVQWQVNGAGMARYYVVHNRMDYNNYILYTDTTVHVDSIGHRIVVNKYNYMYYNADLDSAVIPSLSANDTILQFNYYRMSYTLTWNLNGGQFNDGFGAPQTLKWGTPIDYTHTPAYEGHNFIGWLPNTYTDMPHYDLTLNAQYAERLYGLTWTGVGGTTPYTGQAINNISATYNDDNGNTVDAILTYIDNDGNSSSSISAVGSYRIIARSPNPNYHFNADTVRTIIIVPDTLTVVGTTVEDTKLYDGTFTAVVTNPGTLQTVHGSDQVTLTTTALFTDATPGDGKTIVAHYTISGPDVASYVLDTNSAVIVRNAAAIVAPITPNAFYGPNGGGYQNAYGGPSLSYEGYCTNTATVNFKLTSGNPDQFKLAFSAAAQAQGFTDVAWTATVDDTTIQFAIPDTADGGDYTVTLTLRESAYPQYESAPITINFAVGMNKDYVTAIFGDVLTIVNKDEMVNYDQYSWFCNGVEIGEYGQYYQDPNGLSSSNYYYVELTNSTTGAKARTCPQSFVNVLTEDSVFLATYPNPTSGKLTVNITNSNTTTHTLRVMNIMGQVLYTTKFEGDNYNVDLEGYANGTYTVTVDGSTVRVIKK